MVLKLASVAGAGLRGCFGCFDPFCLILSFFLPSQAGGFGVVFRSGRSSFIYKLGNMKSSVHVILFFLLGLVASFALPKRQSRAQFAVVDFSGKAVSDYESLDSLRG